MTLYVQVSACQWSLLFLSYINRTLYCTCVASFAIFYSCCFRLHYMTSTNCGLCQGNMSWCYDVRGPSYHWVIEMYERLNLPVVPAIVEALQKEVADRMKEVQRGKTDQKKKVRIQMKVARAEEQEARKKWVRRQALQHTYGEEEDEIDGEDAVDPALIEAAGELIRGAQDNGDIVHISGRSCRCGSKQHKRTSHSSCPLNPRNK